MNYEFLAQILIILILIITNSRFFLFKKIKGDSLSVLSIVGLIISILNIVAFGPNPLNLVLFLETFSVWLWNIRAVLRFSSNLVIDHWGPLFKIISSINLLISIGLCAVVILFMPAKSNQKKFNILVNLKIYTENTEISSSDSDKKFVEVKTPFEKKLFTLYEITKNPEPSAAEKKLAKKIEKENKKRAAALLKAEKKNSSKKSSNSFDSEIINENEITSEEKNEILTEEISTDVTLSQEIVDAEVSDKISKIDAAETLESVNPQKIIIFMHPKTADFKTYENLLYKLAFDGYKVYTADFRFPNENLGKLKYFNFLLKDYFRFYKFLNQDSYSEFLASSLESFTLETEALISTLNLKAEDFVLLLTDEEYKENAALAMETFADVLDASLNLGEADDSYETKGWGPVENSNPQIAAFLRIQKDGSNYLSSHLASKVEKYAVQFNGL